MIWIGILIYVIYTVVNRFFYRIPDHAAYVILGIGIVCMIAGIIMNV